MDALKRTIPCFRGFTLQLYTKVLIAILFTFMTPIRYFNGHSDCPPNQTKNKHLLPVMEALQGVRLS